MSDLLVGRLFNDFVDVFQAVTGVRRRTDAIWRINNGLCGMAAMAVGNVLIHAYDYPSESVHWRSHCLHMWLRVDGVDYDSMYPQGYPPSVVDEWLLPGNYNDSDMGDPIESKEDNSGYMQMHLWYCQLVNELFYARHGVTPPDHVIANRKRLTKNSNTCDWRSTRRYFANAKKAKLLPLKAMVGPVEPTGVLPMLHYHYGEFDTECIRSLLTIDLKAMGCSKAKAVKFGKKMQKASRVESIHVMRL